MDVILHVGAHRTGTTSFQHYLRAHRDRLDGQAIGFWGPWRTRKGMFHGLLDRPETPQQATRARGRVQLNLKGARKANIGALIVSEENMLGTVRGNLSAGRLYPQAGERLARVHAAFGKVRRIVLVTRSPEAWWASAWAFAIPRGVALPGLNDLATVAGARRGWRDVIMDIHCACPDTRILVAPFETFRGHPDRLFHKMTGALIVPDAGGAFWANRSPDVAQLRKVLSDRGDDPTVLPNDKGRWCPFDDAQAAAMRETYADDLFWLRAGADGMATLIEDPAPERAEFNPPRAIDERGQRHERPAQRLERSR